MVLSYVAEAGSGGAPPLYNPVGVSEPWTLEGEAWGDWSTTLPPLQQQPDPQRAWDGCIQDIHQCLTTMEVIMSSLDPKDRDSSTLHGVMSRIEHLREWLDVSDDEDYPPLFLPAFSPKGMASPPRVPSPVPVSVPMAPSVPVKAEMLTSTVSKATHSTATTTSKTRSCDALTTTTTTTTTVTRRDAKRRKTATPADLRKTCEKQLLWTIMKLLKETAPPEHFPFGKKDKTRLEDLRSALAVYNGPWGCMVIPQIVQERLAWKLKLSLSPFCRQLIDFLLEQKQGLGDGYREMIIRMGFVHTFDDGDDHGHPPMPLKNLLEIDMWEPRRRSSFEMEVSSGTGLMTTTTTLALDTRFQPRTPLLELLEEVTHKVEGLPGYPPATTCDDVMVDEDEAAQQHGTIFVVIKIDGPPRRSFLIRGALDEWELCDHTQECSVRVSTDHVVCHMMLERADTSILVYPTLHQALSALSSFAPSRTPDPFVSLAEEPPAWPQQQQDDDHDSPPTQQPQQQPAPPQQPAAIAMACAPASATSNTVPPSLSPPPVASFCDIRSRHPGLALLNLPEALSSGNSINHHHHFLHQHQHAAATISQARLSPPGPIPAAALTYAVSPLVISSSSSSSSAATSPALASPDSTISEADLPPPATTSHGLLLPQQPLRIVVPPVTAASFASYSTDSSSAHGHHRAPHAGDFSPISFFTSSPSPTTAMAQD